jgi:hypothetical protein
MLVLGTDPSNHSNESRSSLGGVNEKQQLCFKGNKKIVYACHGGAHW